MRLVVLLLCVACQSRGTFNQRVLDVAATYPAQGYGGYVWPATDGDGTTRDLVADGDVIAHRSEGNHCVGVTLEVFWRALEACPGGVPLDADEALRLKRTWYVPEVGGAGAAAALIDAGLGDPVALDDARPGDFVQVWRPDGLGHSAIFLGWIRTDGVITGIRYWSSQPWTDGIDVSESAVGGAEDEIDPRQIYIARARCH